MQDEIEEKVSEIMKAHRVRTIYCVGYSHGGALALLATEDMTYLHQWEDLNVLGIGFGAPRVVWGWVPKAVKRRLYNYMTVRNIPDIVTHVPPMVLGYRNISKPFKIGAWGKYSPIKAHYPQSYRDSLIYYEQMGSRGRK